MMRIDGPVSSDRLPFRSVSNPSSSLHFDLGAVGYVEEEFFIEGHADVRGPDGELVEADAGFSTRVLVRRPRDGFSGIVHLEPFHVLSEDTPSWTAAHRYLVNRRQAWAAVTVNAGAAAPGPMGGGVPQLKDADPERYGHLHLAMLPPPPELETTPDGPRPFDPESMRLRLSMATPQGHAIIADVAAALRDAGSGLLGGDGARHVYASGWSQTGLFWKNYLDHGHHERARRRHGTSPLDAYLVHVAPGPDHRPDDAVLWHVLSESEVVGTLNPPMESLEDSDDGVRSRGYEVPGAFHYWHLSRHQRGIDVTDDHPRPHNDRAWYRVTHALLAHLDRWVLDGTPPPRAPRIEREPSADDGVARDDVGNARGGVPNPWIAVPTATYHPRCTCNPAVGSMAPLDDGAFTARYGSFDAYADRLQAALDDLVTQGWLLREDADEICGDLVDVPDSR